MSIKCPKCQTNNPETATFCADCGTKLISKKDIEVTATIEAPREELTRGTSFAGRYEIIEELGKGGMGRVYRVEDTKLKQEVALKLIKPDIAKDKRTIERFRNELKLARTIRHKNVCGMFDLGEIEGAHFITMEYVQGEDLRSLIRRIGQLPIGKSISIAKQICDGLSEAHRSGVVHRDLKSNNIMIDKEGNVRIMDFGIARSLESKGITGAGVMIGTPEYMSPEQVEGKEIDQRSDIYSLGIILFEMLTGRLPFEGDTSLSIAVKHKSEKPPNPNWLNPQIHESLSHLVLKCMEKEKEDRYQKAGKVLFELDKIEKDITTTERTALEKRPEAMPKGEKKWRNSIAVLPFTNMSADPEQDYFCDGMAEEIINALTHVESLRVVARTSAFAFKGKSVNIKQIGEELNVESVLEGSVRKAGNRLRITAQLISVADGYHLWSERFERELDDIFAIQDEVTLAIVDSLKVKLLRGEKAGLTKRYTENIEAYNLNLKGRHFLKHYTKDGLQKGLESFQKAIEKDPKYAVPYVGIATYYNNLGYYNFVPPKYAFPKAKEAIDKALGIDESLGEAHTGLGSYKMFYEWDWEGAEREHKRAIELNPNNASSLNFYAHYLWILGRFEEALKKNRQALELNPLSRMVAQTRATIFWTWRQYDKAIEEYKKLLEMSPEYYTARFWLAFPYAFKGMHEKAISTIEEAIAVSGGGFPLMWTAKGVIYSVAGKKDEAKRTLSKMLEQAKKSYVAPWMIAAVYGGLGQKDKAFEWLEKSFKERDHWLTYLKMSPVVDSLRSDPRFTILLKKMNFE